MGLDVEAGGFDLLGLTSSKFIRGQYAFAVGDITVEGASLAVVSYVVTPGRWNISYDVIADVGVWSEGG